MNPPPKLVVLGLVGVAGLMLSLMALTQLGRRPKPAAEQALPVLFSIPGFSLTNQDQQVVSSTNLQGKVWLADIIFTRCAGPCPKMTRRMAEVQSSIPATAPVRFVTLTTDPGFDTPAVLRAYGLRFGAAFDRWWFLTGDKATLTRLAADGFKFVAAEKSGEERSGPADLYIHSTFFVLVDQNGQARGIYYYSDPQMKERLLQDIGRLLSNPLGNAAFGRQKQPGRKVFSRRSGVDTVAARLAPPSFSS